MTYRRIEDVPAEYESMLMRLISTGVISYNGEFEFDLTTEMLNVLLVIARNGLI